MLALEPPRYLIKYPINDFLSKGMRGVLPKIFLTDMEIMILIEFPELAVYDVEMLIREVLPDLIDVLFTVNNFHHRKEITLLELTPGYLSVVASIHSIEDSVDDSVSLYIVLLIVVPYRS